MTGDRPVGELLEPATGLTLVYDGSCAFCISCRNWVAARPARLPLRFVDSADPAATQWLRSVPGYGDDILLVASDGRVWVGDEAIRTVLWALLNWRWAAGDGMAARSIRRLIHHAGARRTGLSAVLRSRRVCDQCAVDEGAPTVRSS